MNKNRLVLLKTMLLSTSRLNIIKHSKDKKHRGKAIGGYVGLCLIYLLIMLYCVMTCIGYGYMGLIDSVPAICVAVITVIAFVFTFLKTNGYLFAFKEYDMLMSLPFSPKTIAADKFLYMYVATLPWFVSVSFSMMIGYGIYAKPNVGVYFIWLILTFVIPIIPMIIAAFLGFIIAKISTPFKKKNIIQTVLTFVFVIFCFSLQYIIEAVIKSDDTKQILNNISDSIEGVGRFYPPITWFCNAIRNTSVLNMLFIIVASVVLFELVFVIVGANYRQINTALKSHAASKAYHMSAQKKRSVVNAIAFKEFKRLTGSTTYLVQGAMGDVLCILLGLIALFVSFDKIISVITKGAPIQIEIVYPAIPFIVYFFIGMLATTACTPSLEGKNYWILQSLPIEKKTIYQGKMLFNIYLNVPIAVFTTLALSFSARVSIVNAIIYLIEIICLCLFSTTRGMACGIKHMKLDWENEIEVVKQGTAVTLYLLPNMFGCMIMTVLVVFLGTIINSNLLSIIIATLTFLLAVLYYLKSIKLSEKK